MVGRVVFLLSILQLQLMTLSKADPLNRIVYDKCIEGLCEHSQNYPTELAKKLIAELNHKKVIFNVDELPPPEITFDNRSSFAEEEEEKEVVLCESKEIIIAPEEAVDLNNISRRILQDNGTQQFRIELCNNSYNKCNGSFHPSVDATCIQKYSLKLMYYINDDNMSASVEYFKVPTCCSCVLLSKHK